MTDSSIIQPKAIHAHAPHSPSLSFRSLSNHSPIHFAFTPPSTQAKWPGSRTPSPSPLPPSACFDMTRERSGSSLTDRPRTISAEIAHQLTGETPPSPSSTSRSLGTPLSAFKRITSPHHLAATSIFTIEENPSSPYDPSPSPSPSSSECETLPAPSPSSILTPFSMPSSMATSMSMSVLSSSPSTNQYPPTPARDSISFEQPYTRARATSSDHPPRPHNMPTLVQTHPQSRATLTPRGASSASVLSVMSTPHSSHVGSAIATSHVRMALAASSPSSSTHSTPISSPTSAARALSVSTYSTTPSSTGLALRSTSTSSIRTLAISPGASPHHSAQHQPMSSPQSGPLALSLSALCLSPSSGPNTSQFYIPPLESVSSHGMSSPSHSVNSISSPQHNVNGISSPSHQHVHPHVKQEFSPSMQYVNKRKHDPHAVTSPRLRGTLPVQIHPHPPPHTASPSQYGTWPTASGTTTYPQPYPQHTYDIPRHHISFEDESHDHGMISPKRKRTMEGGEIPPHMMNMNGIHGGDIPPHMMNMNGDIPPHMIMNGIGMEPYIKSEHFQHIPRHDSYTNLSLATMALSTSGSSSTTTSTATSPQTSPRIQRSTPRPRAATDRVGMKSEDDDGDDDEDTRKENNGSMIIPTFPLEDLAAPVHMEKESDVENDIHLYRVLFAIHYPVRVIHLNGGAQRVVVAKDFLLPSGISKENVARTTKNLMYGVDKFKIAVPSAYCMNKGQQAVCLSLIGLQRLLESSRRLRRCHDLKAFMIQHIMPLLDETQHIPRLQAINLPPMNNIQVKTESM